MAAIRLPHNGWTPRADQRKLWTFLENGGRLAVAINHRRWGKDEIALHWAAVSSVERVGTYWHMLPEAAQARKAIWNAVNPRTGKRRIDDAFPSEMRENINEGEMFIRFKNGSTWQVVGSDNYNSLVGAAPVGVVWSEYALADPESYGYLSPILAENKGWGLFISTSRGNNHLWRQHDLTKALSLVNPAEYYAEIVTAKMSTVFTPIQLEQERQSLIALYGEEHGEAKYNQEYMCGRDGAVFGNYYSKQMVKAREDGRICSVPASSGHEVYTFWDLGVDDSTTIWFMQFVGKEIRVIDYYEATGMGMAHYAKVLKEKNYHYGDHYMPHDADYREMGGGEYAQTPKDNAENLGIRPITVVPRARDTSTVISHIGMVRNVLDSMWFDEEKCTKGLSALEGYRADYDEKKKKLDNKPLHSWESHGADAMRTFAVGYASKRRNYSSKPRPSNAAYY